MAWKGFGRLKRTFGPHCPQSDKNVHHDFALASPGNTNVPGKFGFKNLVRPRSVWPGCAAVSLNTFRDFAHFTMEWEKTSKARGRFATESTPGHWLRRKRSYNQSISLSSLGSLGPRERCAEITAIAIEKPSNALETARDLASSPKGSRLNLPCFAQTIQTVNPRAHSAGHRSIVRLHIAQ